MLDVFFKDNRELCLKIGLQAGQPRQRHEHELGSPEVLPKTIPVTMHQQVIYYGILPTLNFPSY
jgi:hypothetical protein